MVRKNEELKMLERIDAPPEKIVKALFKLPQKTKRK